MSKIKLTEEELEEQRAIKQTYLRKEIVDSGLDALSFQNYLESLKIQGGSDVDQWEINELIQIVENFKVKLSTAEEWKENNEKIYMNQEEEIIEQENDYDMKTPGIILEKKMTDPLIDNNIASNDLPQNTYSTTILCKKRESLLEGNNYSVKIKDFKIKHGGLFTPSHISYIICTSPLGWEVQRRFSDFNWLRSILLKLFPQYIIPPLPSKKSNQKHDRQSDEKRQRFLENFLNNLIKCDEIRNTKIVFDFLNIVDPNVYKIKKKEVEKIAKSNKLDENETLSGKINLLIDKDSVNMLNKLPGYFSEAEMIYKKIKKIAKQLISDYFQMSNSLSLLGENFTKLFEINNKLTSLFPEKKFNSLNNVYVTLNNVFISWGQTLSDQSTIIQKNLCEFFKYQKKEFVGFREILKNRQNIYQDFNVFSTKLRAKKEKAFQNHELTKWELETSRVPVNVDKMEFFLSLKKNKEEAFKHMFFKETSIENDLKDQYAYINKQTYEEVSRCFDEKFNRYCTNFLNFSSLQSDFLSDMHLLWADVNSLLSIGLKEGASGIIFSNTSRNIQKKEKELF